MLVNGKWSANWDPVQKKDEKGRFIRQVSSFRNWITPDGAPGPTGDGGFKAEPGRYHLYITLNCPWASRTLIVRRLKKLEDIISLDIAEPFLTDQGWRFGDYPGTGPDTINGANYMHELYTKADPNFSGRATVPVLWDRQTNTMINNESADIIRMLNSAFDQLAEPSIDLYPEEHRAEIDEWNPRIYEHVNNGVYRSGFAQTQEAYEEAVTALFEVLDELDQLLSDDRQFLFGDKLTETDIRLFVTLIRFDIAYYGQFKTNIHRIADYAHLSPYVKRLYNLQGMADTVNFDHIKGGYYSIRALNPLGIVPKGPELDLTL